jgi:hypothetical protein
MRAAVAALAAALALAGAAPALAQDGGDADDPLIVILGSAEVRENETVEGVFVVNADTRIAGTVRGDAVVIAGETTVSGTIEGDLVTLSGPAQLLPSAEVEGDLIYGDEEPEIAAAATVGGELRDEGWNWDDVSGALPLLGGIAIWIAMTISGLVLGLLLIAFAPRAADAVARRAREEPGLTVALGIGAFIALPVVAFGAIFTLVGVPLAIAILLALLPLAAVSHLTTAFVLGRVMVGAEVDRYLCFLAGFAVLRVLALVPVLGLIVWLAAVVFGLGALVLAAHRTRSGPEDYAVAQPGAA